MWKIINIILRIIALPFVLGLILVKYNAHAIINAICFLMFGGEWITYAKQEHNTINEIYLQLKNNK